MPILDSPDFGRAFVPIESLTSSPGSSTGSASVLEWNSNSGSDGLSVRSSDHELYFHSSPPTPLIPALSSSPKESLPGHDQILHCFQSAVAPEVDSQSNTVTSDTFVDEYRSLLGALEERLILQDSATHSYSETAGLDRPETPSVIELSDKAVHGKQQSNTALSPDRSVATDSSISAVTIKPSLHVSSLFLPPASSPHVYPPSPSVVSDRSESESISIAQYFQLKAAKGEPVQPPVDGPPRPSSAASYLSYTSTVESPIQTPVAVPLPDRAMEAPLYRETWHDFLSRVGKDPSSTTAHPPSAMRQCSFTCPETPPYQACGERAYAPYSGPATDFNCFPDPPSSSSRKLQTENNKNSSQFNPFTAKITPPLSQGTDIVENNLKGHAHPRVNTWPIPPVVTPGQFNAVTPSLKPIKSFAPGPPKISRQLPYVTYNWKTPTCRPAPSCPLAPSSAYPTSNCQPPLPMLSHQVPWSNGAKTRDAGQASPVSTDFSGSAPGWLPSTPSISVRWPSPTPSGSVASASAVPPRPPQVNSERLSHALATGRHNGPPNSVPFEPPAPNFASPLNGGVCGGAYTSTQRAARTLPTPKPFATCCPPTPSRHTGIGIAPENMRGSTLPRDMHLYAGPPAWGPTPRRLRFAPLPPTPSAGLPYAGIPSSTLPYSTQLPPYPLHPISYPYQPLGPQIPAPVSAPYPPLRPGALNSQYWAPHPVFWYSDGSIVFRIEDVGYKVHRHFFERHSVYFRDLLAYPAYAVTSQVPHDIFLAGVKKVDFERLLLIFYPSNLIDPELFTVEEWTSILALSDKFKFTQLKTLATRELGYITTPIEQIVLAKKYSIVNSQWLLPAYRGLCTRRVPLSLDEAEKLGLETTVKIWEVQHDYMMGATTWGRSVDTAIQDKFGLL